MTPFATTATASTPSVHLDPGTGEMKLMGESYPENSFEFYRPILDWIQGHLAKAGTRAHLQLDLAYLNTGSIKCLMDVFDLFDQAHRRGSEVRVTWRYHSRNPRAREAGEEFGEDVTFPFELVAVD